MYLSHLKIRNHPVLGDINLNLINPKTNKPYAIIAFVGENGCGKTTLLNEIFNYNNSQFICDKEESLKDTSKLFEAVYLRQGSLHKNAMKEVRKLIDGQDMYPVNSLKNENRKNKSDNTKNSINKGLVLLRSLGDKEILDIFKENHVSEVYCSNDVSIKIDGKEHGYNIANYSSGQQEILLKLKDLKNTCAETDCVLLDEPETSLHPRWQKIIIRLIQLMLENDNSFPQIFLATHSEKVLESLVSRDDVLIVRLSKNNKEIELESISEMKLLLPFPTFAELDYVIFHISSMDYHDQLFTFFGSIFDKDSSTGIDLKIEKKLGKMYGKHNIDQYKKERVYTVANRIFITKMLPTYIRDYFHHPTNIAPPTKEELELSICVMRGLIEFVKKSGIEEIEVLED